jgi:hypothetical protein
MDDADRRQGSACRLPSFGRLRVARSWLHRNNTITTSDRFYGRNECAVVHWSVGRSVHSDTRSGIPGRLTAIRGIGEPRARRVPGPSARQCGWGTFRGRVRTSGRANDLRTAALHGLERRVGRLLSSPCLTEMSRFLSGLEGLPDSRLRMIVSLVNALKTPTAFTAGLSSDVVDERFAEVMTTYSCFTTRCTRSR